MHRTKKREAHVSVFACPDLRLLCLKNTASAPMLQINATGNTSRYVYLYALYLKASSSWKHAKWDFAVLLFVATVMLICRAGETHKYF